VNVSSDFVVKFIKGLLKRAQTHRAPRAGHIRDEINFEMGGHKRFLGIFKFTSMPKQLPRL
jgi:hypothetical protein